MISRAYESIKPYEHDSEPYKKLYDRILKESIALRCFLIDFYTKSFPADKKACVELIGVQHKLTWRREEDSNLRYLAVYTLSKRAH